MRSKNDQIKNTNWTVIAAKTEVSFNRFTWNVEWPLIIARKVGQWHLPF